MAGDREECFVESERINSETCVVMEEEAECVWISCSFLRAAATTHKEKSVGVTGESSLKWKD